MKLFKLGLIFLFVTMSFIYTPIDSSADLIDKINKQDDEMVSAEPNDENAQDNKQYSYSAPDMTFPGDAGIDPHMLIPGNPDIDPKMLIKLRREVQIPVNESIEDPNHSTVDPNQLP